MPVAEAQAGKDPVLLEGLIRVYSQLEQPIQLHILMHLAAEWTGAEAAFALGPGEERGALAVVAATVPSDDRRHRSFGYLGADHVQALVGREAALYPDAGPLPRIAPDWPEDSGACGVLPVLDTADRWCGALLLIFGRPAIAAGWTRVVALLDRSRGALANALQVASMRELVIKDDTAHCYNRRYFEEFLPEELARASRFRAPLSLIFLDMDNLKEVNNLHGHAMGSRTLTEVSSRVRRKIRKFDRLFRFGGDEFCILLPETEWHGAMEVAERVREAIAGRPFLTTELGPGRGVSMTASLGIAAYPLHARTQNELVQLADRAMQRIKKGTKNAVAVAEMIAEATEAG